MALKKNMKERKRVEWQDSDHYLFSDQKTLEVNICLMSAKDIPRQCSCYKCDIKL